MEVLFKKASVIFNAKYYQINTLGSKGIAKW